MGLNKTSIERDKLLTDKSNTASFQQYFPSVVLLVLNFNGVSLLSLCLPSIVQASKCYKGNARVVMVDNESTDRSVEFVASNFPEIEIKHHSNDFLFSFNDIVPGLEVDIAILMNNDVMVEEQFIEPLVGHFKDREVFAVGPRQLSWSTHEFEQGGLTGRIKNLYFSQEKLPNTKEPIFSLFVSGCAFAVNIEKFKQLGGFDELLKPYYFEEADLCLRAWDRGWKVIYEPRSVISHKHYGTMMSQISCQDREEVFLRNLIILTSGFPLTFWQRLAIFSRWCFTALKRNYILINLGQIRFIFCRLVYIIFSTPRYQHFPEQVTLVGLNLDCNKKTD